MTFPVPGGATFLRARSNLADVASPAAALADLGGLGLVATTGVAGFALQNATPTILSWTAPNDGQIHRVLVESMITVTSAETGGAVNMTHVDPAGNSHSYSLLSAGQGTGGFRGTVTFVAVQPGSAVTVVQTALSAGAATLWAEIWAL